MGGGTLLKISRSEKNGFRQLYCLYKSCLLRLRPVSTSALHSHRSNPAIRRQRHTPDIWTPISSSITIRGDVIVLVMSLRFSMSCSRLRCSCQGESVTASFCLDYRDDDCWPQLDPLQAHGIPVFTLMHLRICVLPSIRSCLIETKKRGGDRSKRLKPVC